MVRPMMWNYDKPHRCPECHRTWVFRDIWDNYGVKPHWWKTYQCQYCDTRFTGRWAWWPKTYYSVKFRFWHLYREIRWRMAR